MKRDYRFFEGWARRNNMVPVGRYIETDADILIADSGEPFMGTNKEGIIGRWYRTAFAIDQHDKTWLASFNDYPATDFDLISRREGQARRVRECLVSARDTLSKTAAAGLYDHARRESFTKRPH